ncbi:hypothetical protein [Arthrobacter sp. B3I4]|uniref:hypothetical protein n=1 Tax=Arthrobacter sp. B3I4 TaxID=3042267 RepID=UPI0027894083|nr:hypothetical protein [Arthrobacter sp. B3I4]MDQ0755011.1 hypothetical protein [Arthrobacter sp. B3I4]
MTEKPVSDVNVRRGDAGMPGAAPTDGSGEAPVRIPPVRIPPRPSAPPTSAVPVVAAPAPPPAAPEPETPASRRSATRTKNRTTPAAAPDGQPAEKASNTAAGRSMPGAEQLRKQLAARTAQLRAAQLGPRARSLGSTALAGAQAGAQRLGPAKIAAALAAVVVLALLMWWLTSLGSAGQDSAESSRTPAAGASSAPADRGPLPLEGVSPLDFRLGDCFKDFDPNAATSTVVACDAGHSAQLVAVQSYAASDTYPGRDPLKQRALDACKGATLTEKSSGYTLNYKLA